MKISTPRSDAARVPTSKFINGAVADQLSNFVPLNEMQKIEVDLVTACRLLKDVVDRYDVVHWFKDRRPPIVNVGLVRDARKFLSDINERTPGE